MNKLYAAIREALKEPKLREYLIASGDEPRGDLTEEFRKMFAL